MDHDKADRVVPDFRRTLFVAAKVALAVGVLTAILSLFISNSYTSEARVLPKDPRGGAGGMGDLLAMAASFGVNIGAGGDASEAYIDILKSQWVSERILNKKYTFHTRFGLFGKPQLNEDTLLGYLQSKNLDRGIKDLRSVLNFDRDMKSGLLTIKATVDSQDLSQQLSNECVNLLEEFISEHSRTQSGAKATFAGERLKEAIAAALVAENDLRRFSEMNRNYQTSLEPRVRLEGARFEAELQLRRTIVSNLALARENALLNQKDDTPILNVLDPGNFPYEKSKPKRAILVLGVMFFVGAGMWTWQNRVWVRAYLTEDKD